MVSTHKVGNKEEVEIDGRETSSRSANFLGILICDRLSFNHHTIALRKKNFPVFWVLCIKCQGSASACSENDVLFVFLSSFH